MKKLLLLILLTPYFGFSQSLHQLTPGEITLLNISKISAHKKKIHVEFNFNGAGFVGRTNIISGLPYSKDQSDTTYTSSGKVKTVKTNCFSYIMTNNFYYSDTLVDNVHIELLKFIDFYRDGEFDQKVEFNYQYDLKPIKETYKKLIGTWTVCYSFSSKFWSYNTDIDSLLFTRGKQSCIWRKGKYSNTHILYLNNDDSFSYEPQLYGKKRKIGIEYFKPCWMWTYDVYGFSIGYIKGLPAMYGKTRFVDSNNFWLIFEKKEE
ncbi:MAG: hypothetical protein ACI8ZM_001323 [Crocinitomix sp.]|jgi:hypothetical protein